MRTSRRALLAAAVALLPAAGAAPARAQPATAAPDRAAATPVFTDRGLAIRGHDPVAYFRDGRPVRGLAAFTYEWQGVTWRFATIANRDAFAADPDRYAPQFGGFCAFAVAHGYHAPIDPTAWKIVDGRLYLNFDRATQRRWEADIPGFIARGEAHWPAVAETLRAR